MILVEKFIQNSKFLAEHSDLMIKYLIDDFLFKNIDINQINKWKEEAKTNINVQKELNYFKITGIFGNFPLFVNTNTDLSIWKKMFRELDLNIDSLSELS